MYLSWLGGGEDLGRAEREATIIRIYFMKKIYFQLKISDEVMLLLF